MTRSGGADRQRQLDELCVLAETLIDFYASIEDGLVEATAQAFREVVRSEYNRRSLGALRSVKNELITML